MNPGVYRTPSQRGPASERSGSVAAVLSFIFPGLGHAYLGLRREALIFAVPVLLIFLLLAVWLASLGLTRAGAKLLNPTVAVLFALLALIVGLWWIVGIVSAWREGRHAGPTIAVPVVLIILIASVSLYGANWSYRVAVADPGLTSGLDCTIENCNSGATGRPLASTAAPSHSPTPRGTASQSGSGLPLPSSSDDPYNDYQPDATEPAATIEPGPNPSFDITQLDAHDDGWLNVLLIGLDTRCAGGIVTGANTDTMIVVSANASTGELYMFSFPRDSAQFPLYVGGTMPGYWKLNTFAGYTKGYPDTFPEPGQPALAYELGFLLGMPIDYYASINICGFPQLIDTLGGVDVCNSKTIDDPSYPNGPGQGLGFHLDPGEYHMDGATALAYARSRHGSSDFARARRQQQLLSAVRQAILQPQNLARLPDIITAMGGVVHTNFPPDQIDQLLTLANQINQSPAGQYVFDFPDWAQHLPRTETNGRSVQFLKMDKIAALSQTIFGAKSLYWTGKPVPSGVLPQPSPSETPDPSGTQC